MVPPALWSRLRALDDRCDFVLKRDDANAGNNGYTSMLNFERIWRVEIRDRRGSEGTVTCMAATLAEALTGAIELAESKGWAGKSTPAHTSR